MILLAHRGEVISTTGITLADESVDSDHYVDGSIDNAHLAGSIAFSKMENLTNSRLLVSDGSGDVSVSAVTAAEILQLSGLSANVTDTNLNALTAGSGNTTLHSHASASSGWDKVVNATTSTTQTFTSGTEAALVLNQEDYDTDTMHDLSTNNSRLTCKTAGVYAIWGSCRMASHAGGRRVLSVLLNGTSDEFQQEWDTNQHDSVRMQVSGSLKLAVDDYVQLRVYQSSGGDLATVAGGTLNFGMAKVGTG